MFKQSALKGGLGDKWKGYTESVGRNVFYKIIKTLCGVCLQEQFELV